MSATYNELEPYAAQWIRNLIAAGHVAPGEVDTRSITELNADDITTPQAHFFAGIGVWSLALRMAGVPDGASVWTGSCPCQPFSAAGLGAGFSDPRHLWPDWFRLIRECLPSSIFGEQVASPAGREWFSAVRADLESVGYAVGAADLCAASAGAPHIRQRLFWGANAQRNEQPREESRGWAAGRMGRLEQPLPWNEPWRDALARFRAVGDGAARCVGATDAARNAIVPQVAAAFVRSFMEAAS